MTCYACWYSECIFDAQLPQTETLSRLFKICCQRPSLTTLSQSILSHILYLSPQPGSVDPVASCRYTLIHKYISVCNSDTVCEILVKNVLTLLVYPKISNTLLLLLVCVVKFYVSYCRIHDNNVVLYFSVRMCILISFLMAMGIAH